MTDYAKMRNAQRTMKLAQGMMIGCDKVQKTMLPVDTISGVVHVGLLVTKLVATIAISAASKSI